MNASTDDIIKNVVDPAIAAWDKHLDENPELKARIHSIVQRRLKVEKAIRAATLNDDVAMERLLDRIEEIYDLDGRNRSE
jgi:hypothetical protein